MVRLSGHASIFASQSKKKKIDEKMEERIRAQINKA